MARKKANLDRVNKNETFLAEEGARGVGAALFAGLLDPVNLVPVVGELKGAYTLGRLGKIAEGAYRVGAAGLVSSAASEAYCKAHKSRAPHYKAWRISPPLPFYLVYWVELHPPSAKQGTANRFKFHGLGDTAAMVEKELDVYAGELDSVGAAAVPKTTMERKHFFALALRSY